MGSDPEKMASFTILNPAAAPVLAPRLGKLAVAGRKAISTPHHIPLTTRGAVPHITHDMMRDQTAIDSLYVGLEDFIEKKLNKAAVSKVPTEPHESKLRKFICMPNDLLLILGARRVPPIVCPPSNTPNSISILTAVGFYQLESEQYVEAIHKLQPDIVVGLADLVMTHSPGAKRRVKMVDRTHAFTMQATEQLYEKAETRSTAAYFAPVLPLENTQQSLYLEELETELRPHISGLALYESASLELIPEALGDLPRLLFSDPASPHDIIREVSLGADLLTIPFLSACSDAGIALDFVFPASSSASDVAAEPRPLAFDAWSSEYIADTRPFSEGCECYACRNHHRAYLHHLLSAKEMLAWTLLQVHNQHLMDVFFSQIRASIERGTFDEDSHNFHRTYAPELPEKTGQGPRLRGYHMPASGANQAKRNPKAFGRLDIAAAKFAESQSSLATPDAGAEELEARGFAEKN